MFGFFSLPKRVVDGRATKEVVATAETHSLEAGKVVVIVSRTGAGTAESNDGAAMFELESSPEI